MLGTMRDEDFARRFGRTLVAIRQRRQHRAIRQPRRGDRPWTTEEEKLLGRIKDRDLAKRFDRPRDAVIEHRRKLGIPSYHPMHKAWSIAEEFLGIEWLPERRHLVET